jgi:enamine deaminase RidA (YjgF/YER057c/UK114 family)
MPGNRRIPALFWIAFAVSAAAAPGPVTFSCVESDPSTGFCRAVVVPPSALVHTAQFMALDEKRELVGRGRADTQTRRVLENLSIALAVAGTTLDHAVKLNICARDAETVAVVKPMLAECFRAARRPTVTFVTGQLPHPDALISMDTVALVTGRFDQVTFRRSEKLVGFNDSHVAVLPRGRQVYVAGQAEGGGTLVEATRNTMASLAATLKFLDLNFAQVVSVKSFLQPISSAPEVRAEIVRHFGAQPVPPLAFVEWTMANPIEIELIASAGTGLSEAPERIEFLTPPGVSASPIYSRVTRVNHGDLIFVGGLYGPPHASGESQVRDIFRQLGLLIDKGGSDFKHLAKATYYVSDDASSRMLNQVRPEFYDPKRPPAASKAPVAGVGLNGATITVDMIAVRRTEPK